MAVVIVGGTGNLGFGIGYRLAKAGEEIVIGSRQKEKAQDAAERINQMTNSSLASGEANEDAVQKGNVVILAVPNAGRHPLLEQLKPFVKGKIVVDATIPLAFKPLRHETPKEGSNALETKAVFGDEVRVTAGFHTVSAAMLEDPEKTVHGDTIILGEDEEARQTVISLAEKIGLRAFDGGSLLHARTVEGLTPMIIGMNKRYKRGHIGISLTGI